VVNLCDFTKASLEQSQFTDSQCKESVFEKADLTYVDFSHADLTGSVILDSELYRANLHQIIEVKTLWTGSNRAAALETDEERSEAERGPG